MAAVGSPWCIATKIRAVAPWARGSGTSHYLRHSAWHGVTPHLLCASSHPCLAGSSSQRSCVATGGDSDRGAALHWALEPTTPQGTRACLHATHIKLGLVYEHANMTTSVHVDEQCLRLATVCRPSGGAGVECPHMSVRERYMAHFAAPEKSTLV